MDSTPDIRKKESLTGDEVSRLNFISDSTGLYFRKHYRQGLRSHIFEILKSEDVLRETKGHVIKGMRWFPRAVPGHMLRILRARFTTLDQALDEVKKYKLILEFLGYCLIARSQEFIVEYTGINGGEIVLCGIQEYIDGAALDPWALLGQDPLYTFFKAKFPAVTFECEPLPKAVDAVKCFVKRTRKMIMETGYIPDLAGNGNLIITAGGGIKLVDINNIIKIHLNDIIFLDDKNYPSCDKSVEVLAILEQKILKKNILWDDPLYGHFLSPGRQKRVKELEDRFYQSLDSFHT